MNDLGKRIRALSTKRRDVENLTVADVLAAMEPRPKPLAVAKADLRKQAEAAVAGFSGTITKLPSADPSTDVRPPRYRER